MRYLVALVRYLLFTTYSKIGPFTNNALPAVNKAFLDPLETYLVSVQSSMFITPVQLVNNATITNNTTNTYTATGSGVPSSAKAVYVFAFFNNPAVPGALQFAPHGGTLGQYFTIGNTTVTGAPGTMNGAGWVPVDGSGQIDIKALSAQANGVNVWIYGYASN